MLKWRIIMIMGWLITIHAVRMKSIFRRNCEQGTACQFLNNHEKIAVCDRKWPLRFRFLWFRISFPIVFRHNVPFPSPQGMKTKRKKLSALRSRFWTIYDGYVEQWPKPHFANSESLSLACDNGTCHKFERSLTFSACPEYQSTRNINCLYNRQINIFTANEWLVSSSNIDLCMRKQMWYYLTHRQSMPFAKKYDTPRSRESTPVQIMY